MSDLCEIRSALKSSNDPAIRKLFGKLNTAYPFNYSAEQFNNEAPLLLSYLGIQMSKQSGSNDIEMRILFDGPNRSVFQECLFYTFQPKKIHRYDIFQGLITSDHIKGAER
jgi:hypothetical protein